MFVKKVSVIVPTYNRAYCLARAIDSALAQTHRLVEVVVIDDGSADGTERLVADRYSRDERVKYFRQPNFGVAKARNAGMARATGQFIAFLDSDDVWKRWKLHVQLAAMVRRPEVGMVWTDMDAVDTSGALLHRAYLKQMYRNHARFDVAKIMPEHHMLHDFAEPLPTEAAGGKFFSGWIYPQMFMGSLVHTSSVLLRREWMEEVGGFDEKLGFSGEDYDFHFRTCRCGPVGFIDLSTMLYQMGHPDALTRPSYKVHAMRNCLRTIQKAYDTDRNLIKLPRRMIRQRFAEVNAWYGESLLEACDRSGARNVLRGSLAYSAWQPRTMRICLLAHLPPGIAKSLRAAFRTAKMVFRTAKKLTVGVGREDAAIRVSA